jgi:hypothetical protein
MKIMILVLIIIISIINITVALTSMYYQNHIKVIREQCTLDKPTGATCQLNVESKPVPVVEGNSHE